LNAEKFLYGFSGVWQTNKILTSQKNYSAYDVRRDVTNRCNESKRENFLSLHVFHYKFQNNSNAIKTLMPYVVRRQRMIIDTTPRRSYGHWPLLLLCRILPVVFPVQQVLRCVGKIFSDCCLLWKF